MAENINGVPIGKLPGIESVPDDSMLVVEFLGKAYSMPGAVLRQVFQNILDAMGDSVDDVTDARLTAAIETVLAKGNHNGISPMAEVVETEGGNAVLRVTDASGPKDYPIAVKGATNAVQFVEQTLTDAQKLRARTNIGALSTADVNTVLQQAKDSGLFNGQAGYTPVKDKDYFDGKDGKTPVKGVDYTDGKDGKTPVKGVDYKDGKDGKSAYTYAVEAGYTGTEEAFAESLRAAGAAENAVLCTPQFLTSEQKAIARENIDAAERKDNDVWIVKLSGSFETDYAVTMGGLPAPRNRLNALIEKGDIVIGVADGDVIFPYLSEPFETLEGHIWPDADKKYTLPSGTLFNYNKGSFFAKYNADFHEELVDKTFVVDVNNEGTGIARVEIGQYFFHVIDPYKNDGYSFEYEGAPIPMEVLGGFAYEAARYHKPIFCYQKDAVFKFEDGSTYQPPVGTSFYYDKEAEVFRCEVDGIECTAHVLLYGFRLTAKKTTPYKTAESKADNLEIDTTTNTLFLMSAGERISQGVTLPSGGGSGEDAQASNAVQYVAQSLSDSQKAQARSNIDVDKSIEIRSLDPDNPMDLGTVENGLHYLTGYFIPYQGWENSIAMNHSLTLTVKDDNGQHEHIFLHPNQSTFQKFEITKDGEEYCFRVYHFPIENVSDALTAVSYDSQTLTEIQKYRARHNIGAVSYEQDNLDGTQRAQAIANIGAVSYEKDQGLNSLSRGFARENIRAVSYEAPDTTFFEPLTEEEQAQARKNIDALKHTSGTQMQVVSFDEQGNPVAKYLDFDFVSGRRDKLKYSVAETDTAYQFTKGDGNAVTLHRVSDVSPTEAEVRYAISQGNSDYGYFVSGISLNYTSSEGYMYFSEPIDFSAVNGVMVDSLGDLAFVLSEDNALGYPVGTYAAGVSGTLTLPGFTGYPLTPNIIDEACLPDSVKTPKSELFIANQKSKYADIKAAYDAGKMCLATSGSAVFSLMTIDDTEALFISYHSGNRVVRLRYPSNDAFNCYAEVIHFGTVQYTEQQNLSEAEKAQARLNINAADADSVGTGSVVVSISGNYTNGYSVLLNGQAVTGDALNAKASTGIPVIGIAESEMTFYLSTGLSYRVPKGTMFRYGNANVFYKYRTQGFEFCCNLEDNDFALSYQDGSWVGKAQPEHITFYLIPKYSDDKMISYNGERLSASEAYKLLFDAMYRSRPIYCYQENAVFYAEDGSEHSPETWMPFSFNGMDYSFQCEYEGYVYKLLVSSSGYTPTATKIAQSGGVAVETALPTPTDERRGQMLIVPADGNDLVYFCLKSNGSYVWKRIDESAFKTLNAICGAALCGHIICGGESE